MDYSIKEHAREHYIDINFFDQVDDETLMKYLDDVFLIPALESKNQVVDYSELTEFVLTREGIYKFCSKLNNRCEAWSLEKNRKIAVIVLGNIIELAGSMGRVFLSEILLLRNAPKYAIFW